MAASCPISDNKEFQKTASFLGEDLAYYVYSLNNNQPLSKTKDGKESLLYKQLLEITKSHSQAIRFKSKLFTKYFRENAGDWLSGRYNGSVDKNGEPILDSVVRSTDRVTIAEAIYGHEINNSNNPIVWDYENQHKTVEWTRRDDKPFKQYKTFSESEAKDIAEKVNNSGDSSIEAVAKPILKQLPNGKIRNTGEYAVIMNYIVTPGAEIVTDSSLITRSPESGTVESNSSAVLRTSSNSYLSSIKGDAASLANILDNIIQDEGYNTEIDPDIFFAYLAQSNINNKFLADSFSYVQSLFNIHASSTNKVILSDPFSLRKYLEEKVGDKKAEELIKKIGNAPASYISLGNYTGVLYVHVDPYMYVADSIVNHTTNAQAGAGFMSWIAWSSGSNYSTLTDIFIHAVTHEAIHGLFIRSINNPAFAQYKEKLNQLYNYAKEKLGNKYYGLESIDEFIAEFLSNAEFANALSELAVPKELAKSLGISATSRTAKASNFREWLKRLISRVLSIFINVNTTPPTIREYGDLYSAANIVIDNMINSAPKNEFFSSKNVADNIDAYNMATIGRIPATDNTRQGLEKFRVAVGKYAKNERVDLASEAAFYNYYNGIRNNSFSNKRVGGESVIINKKTGDKYLAATRWLDKNGWYYADNPNIPESVIKRARGIGTFGHKAVEDLINDIAGEIIETKDYKMTRAARKQLINIIKTITKNAVAIYPEVFVYDHEHRITGRIDLVVVDQMGRVYIYDFKMSEKKSEEHAPHGQYETRRYSNGHTAQDINRMQLSLYKQMFEKDYGYQVYGMGVILVSAKVNKSTTSGKEIITHISGSEVNLKKSFNVTNKPTDPGANRESYIAPAYVDFFYNHHEKFESIYKEKPLTGDDTKNIWSGNTMAYDPELPEASAVEEEAQGSTREKNKYNRIRALEELRALSNSLSNINTYLKFNLRADTYRDFAQELYKIRKTVSDIMEAYDNANPSERLKLEKELQIQAEEQMLLFAEFAHTELKEIHDKVEKSEAAKERHVKLTNTESDPESTPNIRELRQWRILLDSLSVVSDISAYFASGQYAIDTIQDTDLDKMFNEINVWSDVADKYYKSEVLTQIADFLAPRYNGVVRKEEIRLQREYRKAAWKRKKGRVGLMEKNSVEKMLSQSEEEYIKTRIKSQKELLRKRTTRFIESQLETASKDVNFMTRWLDNILDTSDAVAASVADLIVEINERVRIEQLRMRAKIERATTALMKEMGYTSPIVSTEKLYGWMVDDYINPETRNKEGLDKYIIRPWSTSFEEDYFNELRNIRELTDDPEEISKSIRAWLAGNLGENFFDSLSFRADFSKFIDKALKDGDINKNDAALLREIIVENAGINYITPNILFGSKRKSVIAAGNEWLSDDAQNIAAAWIRRNQFAYIRIHKNNEYSNKKWVKFMEELHIDPNATGNEQINAVRNYKKDNAKVAFYNLMMDISDQVDLASEAARKSPLGYRLPAVHKHSLEQLMNKENPLALIKQGVANAFMVQEDDLLRGEKTYEDIRKRRHHVLPLYYTNRNMKRVNQSFDLASIYFLAYSSAVQYKYNNEFLAEIELVREFMDDRFEYERKRGTLQKIVSLDFGGLRKYKRRKAHNIAAQFSDFINFAVYGISTRSHEAGIVGKFDLMKIANKLMSFTALNMLSGNLVQAIANVGVGEAQQFIETMAGKYVDPKTYTKASLEWNKLVAEYIGKGDIGKHTKTSKLGAIFTYFNTLHKSPREDLFLHNSRLTRMLGAHDFLYFMQESGEGFMQGRFTVAMLMKQRAYDREGNDIGSIYDYLQSDEDGIIFLNPKVDPIKSKWFDRLSELTEEDRNRATEAGIHHDPMHIQKFKNKLSGLLTSFHGAYGELERVALQQYAIGSMAYMFRKFLVPTFKRRWGALRYVNRTDEFEEGYYRTFAKYVFSSLKDLQNLSMYWDTMTDNEKANVKRATTEFLLLAVTMVVANALLNIDTDDKNKFPWKSYDIMIYQAYRLMKELEFYWSPGAAMQILRSPMAVIAPITNLSKFLQTFGGTYYNKIFHGTVPKKYIYQRGSWRGHYKYEKYGVQLMPILKQKHRLDDLETQLQWFLPRM